MLAGGLRGEHHKGKIQVDEITDSFRKRMNTDSKMN